MYPNEHAGRQTDPKQYDRIRRENNKFGSGIHAIWGIKGDKVELQSVRFDKTKFSPAQAKEWLGKHKFKTSIEPATEKKESLQKYKRIFNEKNSSLDDFYKKIKKLKKMQKDELTIPDDISGSEIQKFVKKIEKEGFLTYVSSGNITVQKA